MTCDDEYRKLCEKRRNLEFAKGEIDGRISKANMDRDGNRRDIDAIDKELAKHVGRNVRTKQAVIDGKLIRTVYVPVVVGEETDLNGHAKTTVEDVL